MACCSAQLLCGTIDLFLNFVLLAGQLCSGLLRHSQLFFAGHTFAEFSQSFFDCAKFIFGLFCKS